MKRISLLFILALLAGCGSSGEEGSGPGNSPGPVPPAEGDLSGLNELPLEEFVRAIVPRLAKEPGIHSPADLAAALDKKWKLHCEQICRIERK